MWPAAALARSALTSREQSSCSATEEAFEEALLCASQCGCGEAVTDVGDGVDDGVSVEDSGVVGPFSAKLCCFT